MRSIQITVSEDGETEIKAVGFKGAQCKEYTKAFEQALGLVKSTTKLPEFYQTAQTQQKVGG